MIRLSLFDGRPVPLSLFEKTRRFLCTDFSFSSSGVISSRKSTVLLADCRFPARDFTLYVKTEGARLTDIMSPSLIILEGLTGCPSIDTFPLLHASAAWLLVLNSLTVHSHLSIRRPCFSCIVLSIPSFINIQPETNIMYIGD